VGQYVNPPIEPWLRGSCGILPAEEAHDIGGRYFASRCKAGSSPAAENSRRPPLRAGSVPGRSPLGKAAGAALLTGPEIRWTNDPPLRSGPGAVATRVPRTWETCRSSA